MSSFYSHYLPFIGAAREFRVSVPFAVVSTVEGGEIIPAVLRLSCDDPAGVTAQGAALVDYHPELASVSALVSLLQNSTPPDGVVVITRTEQRPALLPVLLPDGFTHYNTPPLPQYDYTNDGPVFTGWLRAGTYRRANVLETVTLSCVTATELVAPPALAVGDSLTQAQAKGWAVVPQ
jgi:hypothetical protein